VNLPGVKVCQNCHKPDRAESRCFQCHVYHDWPHERSTEGKVKLNQITEERPKWPVPLGFFAPLAARR
jgi:hypothetical protein